MIPVSVGDRLYVSKDGISAPMDITSHDEENEMIEYVLVPTGAVMEQTEESFEEMIEDADITIERGKGFDGRYERLIKNLSISGEIWEETVEENFPDGFIERLHDDERIQYSEGYKSFAYVG